MDKPRGVNMSTKGKRHKRFRFRATVSFALAFAFLVMAVSGIVIYLAPKGRDARLMQWEYSGWDRQEWVDVHITSCVLFLILGGMHVFYNWRVLRGYLYSKARRDINLWKELLVAMALTGVVLVGTLHGWPPMNRVLLWRQELKHRHSPPGPRGPGWRGEKASPTEHVFGRGGQRAGGPRWHRGGNGRGHRPGQEPEDDGRRRRLRY